MKLKILHLEDSPEDAELVDRVLKKSKIEFEIKVVSEKPGFINALFDFNPDIVLSDHSLPSFNSLEALAIVRNRDIKTPVILVTASMSDEFAAQVMKMGAYDYILKDRLHRLPVSVLNAVEKCRLDNEKEKYIREIIGMDAVFKRAEKVAHFGIWESDLETGIVKWSDEVYELFGYKKNETEPSLQNILNALVPNEIALTRAKIQDAIMNTTSVNIEYKVKTKNNKIKYINGILLIDRDLNGRAIKITGFSQDITAEKEAKLERDKMLIDSQKRVDELEQFSFIVSHNVRAPLTNIKGIISSLKNDDTLNEDRETTLAGLETSVNRLDNVILDLNRILQVRSRLNDKKEAVSFSELVEDIKLLITETIDKEKVEIITDFSAVNQMETNKSYIYSIFYNLIINSIDFRQADKPPVIKITSRKQKGKITLLFEDNGIGIDIPASGDKLFKLYSHFQSKDEGKGMGLFMVKTQVEALNGTITLKSEPNKGTEFKIEFAG